MATEALAISDIDAYYGDSHVLQKVSLRLGEGRLLGLLGPNGAGKSTLIRMLVTLLRPTAGTAIVNGFDVLTQADGVRQSIGVIPQAMTSDLELSVEENLLIFAKLYGVPRARRQRHMAEIGRQKAGIESEKKSQKDSRFVPQAVTELERNQAECRAKQGRNQAGCKIAGLQDEKRERGQYHVCRLWSHGGAQAFYEINGL